MNLLRLSDSRWINMDRVNEIIKREKDYVLFFDSDNKFFIDEKSELEAFRRWMREK